MATTTMTTSHSINAKEMFDLDTETQEVITKAEKLVASFSKNSMVLDKETQQMTRDHLADLRRKLADDDANVDFLFDVPCEDDLKKLVKKDDDGNVIFPLQFPAGGFTPETFQRDVFACLLASKYIEFSQALVGVKTRYFNITSRNKQFLSKELKK